ncbi:hypothetical protein [Falsigemmobacter intermedius]|uniref:hypothetical protein n=1 Tax=Falsigemmobacter intermedius TaxID=1553448 RepID=UPI003EFFE00B
MLTTTTRQIFDRSTEGGTFVAHVFRLPTETDGVFSYLMGLSYTNGVPIGIVKAHTGSVLRHWKRVTAIEEYLMVLGDRLCGIMIYPVAMPEKAVRDRMIHQYQLDQECDDETMENERLKLLGALQPKRSSSDGRAPDPSDA